MPKKPKHKIEVCFSPHDFDLFKTEFELIVVIDALRATSAICAAFQNGIKSLIPVSTIEEAMVYKEKGYLVGAERNGQLVEGFDFGNSPYSYLNPKLKGETVVLSTTNGTKSINIAKQSENATVVIGSFLNLDHLSTWLSKQDKNILCLCSGWKDKFNLEDTICAGAITTQLLETGKFYSDEDSSVAAKYLFLSAKDNIFGYLKSSSHRRRLKKLNLNNDIKYCLNPNTAPVIPILKGDEIVELKDF
ncbi:2-phosphosulfolactate phosphatase [Putridiphycobacter roseus]|uniref:Probable 2-phosphosulfolactate phosphatase n=1 Tax=Putridiphycobacter roseus TaxID=2219161 RepID=A0A2W1MZ45_9FLAO|nr:2-phosphosulfolactate phosphatase [Putridiphycobacter roseus]PZE17479.1 2-phosphosulfolactate phosphatase [Putridiphycobacter roseus]